jgi:erythromycin esterase
VPFELCSLDGVGGERDRSLVCVRGVRLLRFLVERHGFSAYAMESGFVEGRQVDKWVRGGEDQSATSTSPALDEFRAFRLRIGSRSVPSAIAEARTSSSATAGPRPLRRLGPARDGAWGHGKR